MMSSTNKLSVPESTPFIIITNIIEFYTSQG